MTFSEAPLVSAATVLSIDFICIFRKSCFLMRTGLDWWIYYNPFHASSNVCLGASVPSGDP